MSRGGGKGNGGKRQQIKFYTFFAYNPYFFLLVTIPIIN